MVRAALAMLLLVGPALARDNGQYAQSRPDMREWFKAQRNQVGEVCCDDADGHPVADWGRDGGHYWVEYDGHRYDVPASAEVRGGNPYGTAIVWIYPKGTTTLRCFLPGMEG